MKKTLLLVPLVAIMAACSSTKPSNEVKNMGFNASKERQAENTVFKDENGVRVEVDKDGNWVSIRAVGYSTYVTDDSHDKLTALQIASARARGAISAYIDNQVRTETSITKQTKSIVGSYSVDKTGSGIKTDSNINDPRQVGNDNNDNQGLRDREESRRVIITSTERTNMTSANLLKGTTVLAQGFNQSEKTAWVEVGISKVSLQSSKQIKRDISAGLKE